MKGDAVVELFSHEFFDVRDMGWREIRPQFYDDWPLRGV
jgi:hypothetical protein